MVAMFVNAIYFLGKWKYTLNTPYNDTFHGLAGDRTVRVQIGGVMRECCWNEYVSP